MELREAYHTMEDAEMYHGEKTPKKKVLVVKRLFIF